MQLINALSSKSDLLSVRDHVGKVIEKRLGSPLGERKLNELTADILGVKDFNTALGMLGKSDEPSDAKVWYCFLLEVASKNYLQEELVQDILDEVVFDVVGCSEKISDEINNQGWERQLEAIIDNKGEDVLIKNICENTNIHQQTIKNCIDKIKKIDNGDLNKNVSIDLSDGFR